jgi:tetratricopeptide (TPR) repeat protein
MYGSAQIMKYFFWLSFVGILTLFTNSALAKSSKEIQEIAQAVTVRIQFNESLSVQRFGSGVIVDRQEDLYTIVTNHHVACGALENSCTNIPSNRLYNISTADGRTHQAKVNNIQSLGNNLDLAIIQFRSSKNYPIARLATPDNLKLYDLVYTAGFPGGDKNLTFGSGNSVATVNKRLTADGGGYTVIYNAFTLPGMSGSGVYNEEGEIVAIHGRGDRYNANTEAGINVNSNLEEKIGYNRGIPVAWLRQGLNRLGFKSFPSEIPLTAINAPMTADEHFIVGVNKFIVEENSDAKTSKNQAIQEFTTAINLNPKYSVAYFMRANTKEQLNLDREALDDYNQAISLNPKDPLAYNNRGYLKYYKLKDTNGVLADFNQAINLFPQFALAYNNRGYFKFDRLKNIPGALVDYSKAIAINPRFHLPYINRGILNHSNNNISGALSDYNKAAALNPNDARIYANRGLLKFEKLKDISGALKDYNQSIDLNPTLADLYSNRGILLASKNDVKGALADYNKAISINPQDVNFYLNRGSLKHEKVKDLPGALSDYNQAIKIDPKFALAYSNRGFLKGDQEDFSGALVDFNQAIQLNNQFATAYFGRGLLKFIQLENKTDGLKDLRLAAKLFREQGKVAESKAVLSLLRELGIK